MTFSVPLPPAMVRRAREFTGPPAPVRPAATVVLVRPGTPVEVYVMRRRTTMAFGGVFAFPGGGVDPTDRPRTVRHDWAARLGVPDLDARAVVGAAVRELFEETGVLLAGSSLPDADRLAVANRKVTLTDLLDRHGLPLRDDLLVPWSRWVTPEFEPRRFDTWFFVALMPADQSARDVSGEADEALWIAPDESGDLPMLPPTRFTLRDLAGRSVEQIVAAQRNAAVPVMPRIEATEDGGAVLRIDEPA